MIELGIEFVFGVVLGVVLLWVASALFFGGLLLLGRVFASIIEAIAKIAEGVRVCGKALWAGVMWLAKAIGRRRALASRKDLS